MSVHLLKPERTRKPGPYKPDRQCEGCGAKLSRYNPSTFCAPCSGGDWIPGEPTAAQLNKLRRARLEEIGAAA